MTKFFTLLRWLAPLAVGIVWAMPTEAQPRRPFGVEPSQPRPYVRFPINPDYQKILNERLEMEQELGPFKDLIRQMLADPKMLDMIPIKAKDMKLEDPKLKKALQTWLDSDPTLKKSLQEWMNKNQALKQPADVQRLQKNLKQILDTTPADPGKGPTMPQPTPIAPIKTADDPLAKMTERAMKQAQQSKLGEYLRESPAWQRAFEDLRDSLQRQDEPTGMLGDWTSKLFKPDGNSWKLANDTLERLKEMPRPKFDPSTWNVSVPGVGKIPLPDLGSPGTSDFHNPSFSSLGTAASWLLALLIGLLIAARFLRWRPRSTRAGQERPALGPWPVRPEAVATRAELVQAFDYLALWTLGLGVQSWNHHAVVGRWREKAPPCGASAEALERLYEQARYTAGAEQLPEAARDLARRSLLQIAEAL